MKKKEYTILVSVGELWLKGQNRKHFVKLLGRNIRTAITRAGGTVHDLVYRGGQFTLACTGDVHALADALVVTPGIAQFRFVQRLPRDLAALDTVVAETFDTWVAAGVTQVRFETKRRDKDFALTSTEVNARLGDIAATKGCTCNYAHATHTIYTIVDKDAIFFSDKKYDGRGGLPVGSAGRALVLLSGGIDSPVAAAQMLTRGAEVDFLHFHSFPQGRDVLASKIPRIIEHLNAWMPRPATLYCAPYTAFDLALQGVVPPRMHGVFFKNFMHAVADEIARTKHYDMIVNGDALAQVASQTPENMRAASYHIDTLLLRPLVGMNKNEIMARSRAYGLYEESIMPYKDCCSLVAKNPLTRTKFDLFLTAYEKFPMQKIVAATLSDIEVFETK